MNDSMMPTTEKKMSNIDREFERLIKGLDQLSEDIERVYSRFAFFLKQEDPAPDGEKGISTSSGQSCCADGLSAANHRLNELHQRLVILMERCDV